MDLADFVKTTLQQIVKGVEEAQESAKPAGKRGIINPSNIIFGGDSSPKGKHYSTTGNALVTFVQFDVAVTTESGDKVSGGGKISVLGVGIGSEGSVSSKDTTASRIKFEVPVTLPDGGES